MTLRQRTIPCSDFDDWKHDLELTGYHVIDNTPNPGQSGMCTLRFEADFDTADPRALSFTAPLAAAPAPTAPGGLSATQVATAHAIVNIFESGLVLGRYGQVTVLPGDNGHLSFGRSQLSLGSGNLAKLIDAYCKNPGARFGARLSPFLSAMSDRDTSLDTNTRLHNLLRATADDPVMRDTQDSYFDRGFWQQAAQEAARLQIRSALGVATVYDSWVQGAWGLMRDRTIDNHGSVASLGEQAWIAAYIATRRQWLDENPQPILRKTVYRMDALGALVKQQQWSLNLPLLVREQEISVAALGAHPSDCYDGPAPGSRTLAVTAPFARGLDVRLLQLGLSDANLDIKADGVFGAGSAESVRQYQRDNALPVTGVADVALIARLTA